ncbi:MAG: peptidylprolyl isomerase [Deltaproteobacteria bacterium]|nr:peptidylprolyl isomerase [Deltaproteobacteria bacterium]
MGRIRPLLFSLLVVFCLPGQTAFAADEGPAAAEAEASRATRPGNEAKQEHHPALLAPAKADEQAPEQFRARFETTQGDIVIEVTRAWAPNGADRFYNLVGIGFFEEIAFFRVIEGFMAQFGIHGKPNIARRWLRATIPDDPVVQSNLRGMITYAKTAQPNSRTTQLFINLSDNSRLDDSGFAPFGRIVEGMDVVDAIHKTGEGAPRGKGPNQKQVKRRGNQFLKRNYPEIDYLERAEIIE